MTSTTEIFLGIDLGTSSVKAALFDSRGLVLGSGSADYPIETRYIGCAEQSPDAWWRATVHAVRRAVSACGASDAVRAISFSGQMHGLVPLGKDGAPLQNAIIWPDRRSGKEVAIIDAELERTGHDKTCNRAAAGFLLPSLLWMLRNEPDVFERIATVLLPKDYLAFRMTGRTATEPSDASGSLAFDVAGGTWNGDLLRRLGVAQEIFPEIVPTGSVIGTLCERAAAECGLRAGTPVVAGCADQPAQALGNGLIDPGAVSSTIGTGGQIFAPAAAPLYDPKLRTNTFCHAVAGRWYLLGANLSAGYCLKWLQQTLGGGNYDAAVRTAESVPPGSRGLIFLPYLNGDRTPHQDAEARAVFFGLTASHGRAEMTRAVMEGVVFSLLDGLDIARSLGVSPAYVIASGGGARSKLWRQMQADAFGLPIVTASESEQACKGAAILAATGCGFFSGAREACDAMTTLSDERCEPNAETHKLYKELHEVYKALYTRNSDLFKILDAKSRGAI